MRGQTLWYTWYLLDFVFTSCVKIVEKKKSESNFRQDPDSKLLFLIRNTEIKYKKWLTLQFIITDGMGLLSPLGSNIRDIFIK